MRRQRGGGRASSSTTCPSAPAATLGRGARRGRGLRAAGHPARRRQPLRPRPTRCARRSACRSPRSATSSKRGEPRLRRDGGEAPLEPAGWDHFARRSGCDHVPAHPPRRAPSRSPAATPAAAPGIQADLKTFSVAGRLRDDRHHGGHRAEHARAWRATRRCAPRPSARRSEPSPPTSGSTRRRPGCSPNAAIVEAVADAVREVGIAPASSWIRCSVSKHGHALLDEDAVDVLERGLLPAGDTRDAQPPRGERARGVRRARRATTCGAPPTRSSTLGPRAVLVKGGHLRERRRPRTDLFDADGASSVARGRADRHVAHPRHRLHA